MNPNFDAFSQLNGQALDAAVKLSQISLNSAERMVALQIAFAKKSLDHVTSNARAAAGVSDVQQLMALRTQSAQGDVERLVEFSRSLYDVTSEAQAEVAKLAEGRVSSFQQAVTSTLEQATKGVPGGNDFAVNAMKSSLAAATAAFDTFQKASRQAASFADAGVKASGSGRSRK